MENGKRNNLTVAVLTISTSCANNEREDISGDTIIKICKKHKFKILKKEIISDNKKLIIKKLKYYADKLRADIVLTTGGTGLGPHDYTAEATAKVVNRIITGFQILTLTEAVKKTKRAALSTAISGLRKRTLIINLPGSPKAVKENLSILINLLPHAVHIINGGGH